MCYRGAANREHHDGGREMHIKVWESEEEGECARLGTYVKYFVEYECNYELGVSLVPRVSRKGWDEKMEKDDEL